MNDPYELQRFVDAQDQGGIYEAAIAELRRGRKTSHWMWFVFPQLQGLGLSAMARRYAISGVDEARAYLAHPVLGPRLRDSTTAVVAVPGRNVTDILGGIDAMKLCSSMTLFAEAAPHEEIFRQVLQRFYGGRSDPRTIEGLAGSAN